MGSEMIGVAVSDDAPAVAAVVLIGGNGGRALRATENVLMPVTAVTWADSSGGKTTLVVFVLVCPVSVLWYVCSVVLNSCPM